VVAALFAVRAPLPMRDRAISDKPEDCATIEHGSCEAFRAPGLQERLVCWGDC